MRAARLLRLLILLQRRRRATAGQLAAELEVSERTVLRDIEALSTAGVPVYTERGRAGGCVLMDGFTTRTTGLTPTEAQALFAWASRETAAQMGLGPDLASALAKIATTAPSSAVEEAEALGEVVLGDRRRWFAASDEVPWLPALREATSRRRRIRVRYESAEAAAPALRTLDPVGIVDNSGRWYLVAEHRRRARTYRVSRISDVEILEARADVADPRPLSEVWGELRTQLESQHEPVAVVVAVEPGQAATLRRLLGMQLAPGSRIDVEGGPDGSEIWRLQVRQPPVLAAMAVMAAPDLTVLSPAWLVEEIRSGAFRAVAHYSDPSPAR